MLARSLSQERQRKRERGEGRGGEGGREEGRHLDEEACNVAELRQRERLEQDDFIQAIQEFGPEMCAHIRHDVCQKKYTLNVSLTPVK